MGGNDLQNFRLCSENSYRNFLKEKYVMYEAQLNLKNEPLLVKSSESSGFSII